MNKSHPDKHHRRTLRLKDYNYSNNGAYFVTLCTLDRECYFSRFPQLSEIVENLWLDLPVRCRNVWLDYYVIMPNHFHGIIIIDDSRPILPPALMPGLGSIVGSFKSLCVDTWLKAVKSRSISARGKFWQDNYYEHVVRNEDELYRIREYIRNNPIQWELDRENPANFEKKRVVPEKWMV